MKSLSRVQRIKFRGEVPRNSLWEIVIHLSDGGKGKKKAELFYLCKKAATMKQIKIASFANDSKKLLK